MGAGLVLFVRHTVAVDKMGIRAAQLFGFRIHHIRKGSFGTGDMLGYGNADLVGGGQHHRIEAILHRKDLTDARTDTGTVPGKAVDGIVGKGHLFVKGAVLDGEHGGHDLGDTGRVQSLVHIFGI